MAFTMSAVDKKSAWYGNKYAGSAIKPNVLVVHTTEGGSLPDYSGGALAPNLTVDVVNRKVWQHYSMTRSSRALANKPGGVETNTLNAVQIEVIGTCDPKSKVRPYVSKLTDDQLRFLGEVMLAVIDACPGIPATVFPRFKAYPASYGASPARMSFDEWRSFKGICRHQNVPENSHGDPGDLDLAKALKLAQDARAAASKAAAKPAPAKATTAPAKQAPAQPVGRLDKTKPWGAFPDPARNGGGLYGAAGRNGVWAGGAPATAPGVNVNYAIMQIQKAVGAAPTGKWSADTEAKVLAFKKGHNLEAGALVGKVTWAALVKASGNW